MGDPQATPTPPPPPPPPYPTPIGCSTPDGGEPKTRRTRIVCISDTHKATPPVPAGDVLIFAGDMANEGTLVQFQQQVEWLRRQPHEVKIIIAGDQDLALDAVQYREYAPAAHRGREQDVDACRALVLSGGEPADGEVEAEADGEKTQGPAGSREKKRPGQWIYLEHEARTVRLTSPDGPRTEFTVFGSPYTTDGYGWAFRYPPASKDGGTAAASQWAQIPLDTDILVTHGPAFSHRDKYEETGGHRGCEELRKAMWRVRPRLAVCGHIHDDRGAERVRWDLTSSTELYKEEAVEPWTDPAPEGKKMSLVDLTGKAGTRALDNDGSKAVDQDDAPWRAGEAKPTFGGVPGNGSRGYGGPVRSGRSDRPALAGRLGRRETCIVNASIVATASGHYEGPRRLNKAIVVDLDLPVWEEEQEEPTGSRRPEKDGTPRLSTRPARAQE